MYVTQCTWRLIRTLVAKMSIFSETSIYLFVNVTSSHKYSQKLYEAIKRVYAKTTSDVDHVFGSEEEKRKWLKLRWGVSVRLSVTKADVELLSFQSSISGPA